MHHFFVASGQIQGRQIEITGKDVNHIRHVLRMLPGEELSVSNGQDGKEYRCQIDRLEEGRIVCTLRFIKEEGVELPCRIALFQGLPKAGKMELIIQKAVELGVDEIIPVSTCRSVVRWEPKKAAQKIGRWQAVSEAAAKQSRRAVVPEVKQILSFPEAAAYAGRREVKLIAYELAKGMEATRRAVEAIRPGQDIALFIGPEGGFEEREIQEAKAAGIRPITLGRRILRTETAGLAALSWLMYRLEEG